MIITRLNQRIHSHSLSMCVRVSVTQWCGTNNQKAFTLMSDETNKQTNTRPTRQNIRNCTLSAGSSEEWFPPQIIHWIWMKEDPDENCNRHSFALQCKKNLCDLCWTPHIHHVYNDNMIRKCQFLFISGESVLFSFVLRKTKQTKQEQNAVSFYFIRDSLLKCMHARVLYVLFCHRHSIRQQALIHTSLANERTNGGTNNEFNQML